MGNDKGMTASRGGGPADYLLPPRLALPDATPDPELPGTPGPAGRGPRFRRRGGGVRRSSGCSAAATRRSRRPGRRSRLWCAGSPPGPRWTVDRPAGEAFPPGEVLALAADSPCARCMREGAPVIFTHPGGAMVRRDKPGGQDGAGPLRVVPGRADDHPGHGGRLAWSWPAAPAPRRSATADTQAAADLAVRAGVAHRRLAGADAAPVGRGGAGAAPPGRQPRGAGPARDRRAVPAGGRLRRRRRLVRHHSAARGQERADRRRRDGPRSRGRDRHDAGSARPPSRLRTWTCRRRRSCGSSTAPPSRCPRPRSPPARTPSSTPAASPAPSRPPATSRPSWPCPDGSHAGPRSARRPVARRGSRQLREAHIRLRPGTILALYTDGLVETRTRPFDQGILALRSSAGAPAAGPGRHLRGTRHRARRKQRGRHHRRPSQDSGRIVTPLPFG